MFDPTMFALFFGSALILAIMPGPGILYVAARTIAGGRSEGLASSVGTGLGGLVHVVAGAVGLSALMMASAEAFNLVKLVGAAYLIWIGIRTWREASQFSVDALDATSAVLGARRAFWEGVTVEMLNPKTAAFFLAFVPQFVDSGRGSVAVQFLALGVITVALNTGVDVIVTFVAERARQGLARRGNALKWAKRSSGGLMCGLGMLVLAARRPI